MCDSKCGSGGGGEGGSARSRRLALQPHVPVKKESPPSPPSPPARGELERGAASPPEATAGDEPFLLLPPVLVPPVRGVTSPLRRRDSGGSKRENSSTGGINARRCTKRWNSRKCSCRFVPRFAAAPACQRTFEPLACNGVTVA